MGHSRDRCVNGRWRPETLGRKEVDLQAPDLQTALINVLRCFYLIYIYILKYCVYIYTYYCFFDEYPNI